MLLLAKFSISQQGPFRRLCLFACIGLFFSSGAAARPKKALVKRDPPIISRITIRSTDIFDFHTDPALEKFPYTWINALHIKTQDIVVRRELLFKVGDRLDPFLINETERNLRALSFIRAARIGRFPQRDGSVALVVYVNDSWTTEPQINLEGINQIDSIEVGFKEKNLLGLGKEVEVFYNNGDNFIERQYGYTDPRLLGSRWRLDAEAVSATNEDGRNIKIERPFFSADAKWSARGYHDKNTTKIDEVENETLVSSFEQTKEINEVFGGLKIGESRSSVNHIGLRYRNEVRNAQRTDKTALNRGIPEGETVQTVFLDMEIIQNRFIEMTRLEKMTRVEDVNLGASVVVSPGLSPHILTSKENANQFEGSIKKNMLINHTDLLKQEYAYSGRDTFGVGENERYFALLKYYHRGPYWNTLVLHTRLEWGRDLDADNLVKLGSTNGLRSYEEESIIGTRGWVFNAEDRLFVIEELWNLFSVGGAVFYDTGFVWEKGQPVAISELRSAVGAGLRLGLTRSSNEVVLRFDVSYRMQKYRDDDTGIVFTFGTGQAF